SIECDQRDGEVRSMRGDTALAGAEHRMPTILATDGGAAGARRPLVAGTVADIAEVGAARALQEVAAHGRLLPHLRARRVQQRFGDDGKLLGHGRMGGNLRHGGGSAEPQALRSDVDPILEEAREAHQTFGTTHVFLQELHHIRAPAMYSAWASLRPAWARKASASERF